MTRPTRGSRGGDFGGGGGEGPRGLMTQRCILIYAKIGGILVIGFAGNSMLY